MKKIKLKKWVEYLLMTVAFLSFCLMCSDSNNMLVFIITHIIATMTFGSLITILNKFSR